MPDAPVAQTTRRIEKIEDPSAGPPLTDGMIAGAVSRIRGGKVVAEAIPDTMLMSREQYIALLRVALADDLHGRLKALFNLGCRGCELR